MIAVHWLGVESRVARAQMKTSRIDTKGGAGQRPHVRGRLRIDPKGEPGTKRSAMMHRDFAEARRVSNTGLE